MERTDGGCANGIPRNSLMFPELTPCTVAAPKVTFGPEVGAAAMIPRSAEQKTKAAGCIAED